MKDSVKYKQINPVPNASVYKRTFRPCRKLLIPETRDVEAVNFHAASTASASASIL